MPEQNKSVLIENETNLKSNNGEVNEKCGNYRTSKDTNEPHSETVVETISSQMDPKSILLEPLKTIMMTSTIRSVKVGTSRIPSMRFDVLLRDLTLIFVKYGDNGFSKEELKATILNIGIQVIYKKVKELKLFGLVEGRLGRYNITDLGKRIVQFNNSEREKDVEIAMRRVPIWNLFLDNGGKNISDEKIIEILQNDVGLEPEEAQKRFPEIKRAFKRDVLCIKQFNPRFIATAPKKTENTPLPQQPSITPNISTAPKSHDALKDDFSLSKQEDKITISKNYGKFQIEITTDESEFSRVSELLKIIRKELQSPGVPTMGS